MTRYYNLPRMKVVINRRHGGFGLSRAAIRRLMEIGWTPVGHELTYLLKEIDEASYFCYDPDLARHDPRLIQVVEELGDAANGDSAKLFISTVTVGYGIEDYDGMETLTESGA